MIVDKLCIINFSHDDPHEARSCALGLLFKYTLTKQLGKNAGAFTFLNNIQTSEAYRKFAANSGNLKVPDLKLFNDTVGNRTPTEKKADVQYFATHKQTEPLSDQYKAIYYPHAKKEVLKAGLLLKYIATELQIASVDENTLDFKAGFQNGLFLVGHGSDTPTSKFGGRWTPKQLATFLYLLGFQHVTKLVLVACGLGKVQDDKSSYVKTLCMELNEYNMHPKIAGWDEYVTVVSSKNPNSKHIKLNLCDVGKKIVSSLADREKPELVSWVSEKYKTDHKTRYQWVKKEGLAVALLQSEWSDKSTT